MDHLVLNQTLKLLRSKTKLFEMEEKISLCKRELRRVGFRNFPNEWVNLKIELAGSYLKSPTIYKKRNIELSIKHFRESLLKAQEIKDYRLIRKALLGLGKAYTIRIEGHRLKNRELAILFLKRAMRLVGNKGDYRQLPELLHALGNAYRERVHGKQKPNTEEALNYYLAASGILKRGKKSSIWGDIQNDIGLYYLDKYGQTIADIETAIAYFKQALRVRTQLRDSEGWASTNHNLGNAYSARTLGGYDRNTKIAIENYKKALTINRKKVYPLRWAGTQLGIGNACMRLNSRRGGKRAIFHLNKSLDIYTRKSHPDEWASVQISLGAAYLNQVTEDLSEKVEKNIAYNKLALQVYKKNNWPVEWALVHHNLGVGYSIRLGWGKEENIEKSIEHFKKALIIRTKQTQAILWANTQHSLGLAFRNRLKGRKQTNLERAIKCFRLSTGVYRMANPNRYAETISDLAGLYIEKSSRAGKKHRDKAIKLLQDTLERHSKILSKSTKAYVYAQLGESILVLNGGWEEIKSAIRAYKNALRNYTPSDPGYFNCLVSLADIYFSRRQWEEAKNYYSNALTIGSRYQLSAYTAMGRNAAAGGTSNIQNRLAFCLLKLGLYQASFLAAERAKNQAFVYTYLINAAKKLNISSEAISTLELARQTTLDLEADINPGGPQYRSVYDFEHFTKLRRLKDIYFALFKLLKNDYPWVFSDEVILANILHNIKKGEALVVPLITEQGTAIFFLTGGIDRIGVDQVAMEDDFRETDLVNLLEGENENTWGGWIGSYFEYLSKRDFVATKKFIETIELTCDNLGKTLLHPIIDRALRIRVKKLHFVSHGGLQILPLHAARYEKEGSTRYLIDDFEISYSPSVYAFLATRSKVTNRQKPHALLVGVDKSYIDLPPLPNAVKEVKYISSLIGVAPLLERQANKREILLHIKDASYIHFACHARFSWFNDPLFSSFYLADDERLYISEILGNVGNLSARLVTLSSCETGMSESRELPDEQIGFTAAFLQMGASGVVSSLWMVEDAVASLIMKRFYQNHINLNMAPAAALRATLIWLRGLQGDDIGKSDDLILRMGQDKYNAELSKIIRQNEERYLFSSPFYWGSFFLSGM